MEKIAIAGAGFAGAVLAQKLAESGRYKVVLFEERPHLAGNCHTSRDKKTGVMLHHYGPHIFHTSRDDVWKYVNRFSAFGAYTNRVKAVTARGIFSLPINLLTINQFFGKSLDPQQARTFIEALGDPSIETPRSFEEQALKFLGRDLYENFFYGYTKKQWGIEPSELPAAILKRLPIRFNYDDNYYSSKYQGIPLQGYTAIVEKILDHQAIEVILGERLLQEYTTEFDHVFYSGSLDSYFDYEFGRLTYRSLTFERFDADGDYQGNPVMNYCEESIPYTRIAEHKHFAPWETHDQTVCMREYSKLAEAGDIPYYPLRLNHDHALLRKYVDLANSKQNVTFIGRLGTYRYLDMHAVIGESIDLAAVCLKKNRYDWPTFSASPL